MSPLLQKRARRAADLTTVEKAWACMAGELAQTQTVCRALEQHSGRRSITRKQLRDCRADGAAAVSTAVRGMELSQAIMALAYSLAPLQPTAQGQAAAARDKVAQLRALVGVVTTESVTCHKCGHEDPLGGGESAAGVACCRCSDTLTWCVVTKDVLDQLDEQLAALASAGTLFPRSGWLSNTETHARALEPCFAFVSESPLTASTLSAFTPLGMPMYHEDGWDAHTLGALTLSDLHAQLYQKRQRASAEECCVALAAAVGNSPYRGLRRLLETVSEDRLVSALHGSQHAADAVAALIGEAHAGIYPIISYQGGATAASLITAAFSLRSVLQQGPEWSRGAPNSGTAPGATDISLGSNGTYTELHLDNLNAASVHVVVNAPRVRAPPSQQPAKRALSNSCLLTLLRALASAAKEPYAGALRAAQDAEKAFSVWLAPPHAQGRVKAACEDSVKACLGSKIREMVQLVEKGLLQPHVVRHGGVILLTQGCPHAVFNVVPDSNQLMLKVSMDWARWFELPRNCAMRSIVPLGVDIMACSLVALRVVQQG